MPYLNGQIPPPGTPGSPLIVIASGVDSNGYWEFQITPATLARWNAAKAYAVAHFGKPIFIRTGWNVYRPLQIQKDARTRACNQGNCLGAAYPGTSSHGGEWGGRPCLAIDVDPNGLSWAQVWEACRAAGFSCGLITPAMSGFPGGEPWHVIDFNAFSAVPAGMDATPFEEDDMTPEQLQEALTFSVRPNGFGPDAKFGPTMWERLNDAVSVAVSVRESAQEKAKAGTVSALFDTRIDNRNVFDWFIQAAADRAAFDAKDAARDAAMLEAIKAIAAGKGLDPDVLADVVKTAAREGADESLAAADFPTEQSIAAAVLTAQERARIESLEAEVARLKQELQS